MEDTISSNILTTDISDHLATLTTINLDNTASSPYRTASREPHTTQSDYRIINEANNLLFKQLIDSEDWGGVIASGSNAQSQFDTLCDTYTKHYNTAYPLKSQRVRRKNERLHPKPWILPFLEDAIARRENLYHAFVKSPSEENSARYNKLKKFCDKHVNLAKDKYYKKYFEQHKNNSKKQWEMINNLLNRTKSRTGPIKLKDDHGRIVNNSLDVATKFNEHFSSIASNLKSKISSRTVFDPGGFQEFLQNPVPNSMYLSPVDSSEIYSTINKFKNKATLDTKIEPLKIANSCPVFTEILAKVINSSFQQGIFPESLKIARVVPIHKGGSKTDVANYRPISLLSSFSKIYEKLMHKRILDFLDTNSSLFEMQYGFRPGRSCEHALLNAQNTILNSLSRNQVSLLLLIDFSRAFDLVEHNILLKKLEHLGIRGIAQEWFKTYLKGRKQFVTINGVNSSTKLLEYGVPQGSILGPLLFIIYINDLPNISNITKFILYADDANIFITGSNIDEVYNKLEYFLTVLLNWVDVNGLVLNLKKTHFIVFSRQAIHTDREIMIANTEIKRKTEARFLGVIIDEKLTWARHIATIKAKMSRYVGIMYKLKRHLPFQARLQIFHSLVQSHLNFCNLVWGFAAKNHIDGLFRKQK